MNPYLQNGSKNFAGCDEMLFNNKHVEINWKNTEYKLYNQRNKS